MIEMRRRCSEKELLIPAEYQRVEYLQLTSKTGIRMTANWQDGAPTFYTGYQRVEMLISNESANFYAGSCNYSEQSPFNNAINEFGLQLRTANGFITLFVNGGRSGDANQKCIPNNIQNGVPYLWRYIRTQTSASAAVIADDGTELYSYSVTASPYGNNGWMRLFYGWDNEVSAQQSWVGKVWSLKMYNLDDTLFAEFVPCYRKVDMAVGLYDRVSGYFYKNSFDTMGVGPDVN